MRRWRSAHRSAASALALTVVECLLVAALMLGAYALLPSEGETSTARLVLRLVLALLVVGVVMAGQVRSVLRSERPLLRVLRALTTVFCLYLLVFASVYAAVAHGHAGSFTQPLSHVDALYFTVTVFATVGFGDIAPVTESARVLVTLQMVLNLVLLGAGLRLLTGAARMRLKSRNQQQGGPDPGDSA
ncbi:potassium channel family protein [Streptacidiphilus monticola]|uniref:Potassium channel family protein n=1 Tax=Streptacidiphilus monticola TaxID=2161674 RepID=A0ABW1G2H0_9ACTN